MIWKSALLACVLMLAGRQDMGPAQTAAFGSSSPPTSPSFVGYTYVSNTTTNVYTTITSPAMLIGPNELLIAYCRSANTNSSSDLPTVAPTENATGSSFVVIGTDVTSGYNVGQMAYLYLGPGATVASSTFTCTPSAASNYQAMVVLKFAVPAVSLNTSSTTIEDSTLTTITSGQFTTTSAPTMNIFCASGGGGDSFSAGDIAGSTATLVAVDEPSLTDSGMVACEWNTSSSVVSAATGTMTTSGTNYVAILGAFSY